MIRRGEEEEVWRALADPTRRRILDLLRDGPRTTGQIASVFDVTRFAVMKHLGVLERAGIVLVRPKGRERWHHLNAVPLRRAYERWMRPYAERAAASLLRLQETVEGSTDGWERTMGTTSAEPGVARFEYEQEMFLEAGRERVFRVLTEEVGEWFEHRMVGGSEVICEPWVGGRTYEDWGDGQGALWSTTTAFKRPTFARFEGAWGVAGSVGSVVTYRLEERDGGTVLKVSHWFIGEIDDEARASFTGVLKTFEPDLRSYLARSA